jgi:glycine/D-amino acid oxidase-like deaminating enzyme
LPAVPLPDHATADVVVVGAGLAGVSAAYHLAGFGRSVLVIDAGRPGGGGTGGTPGFLLASGGVYASRLERDCGEPHTTALRALSRDALGELRNLSGALDCDYQPRDALSLCLSPREMRDAEATHDRLRALGVPVRLLDREHVKTRTGSALFTGALLDPEAATVDPVRLVSGLARLAAARGTVFHGETTLKLVEEPAAGGVIIHTERGRIHAHVVVVATNAHTPRLFPSLADRVFPYRMQALLTEPVPLLPTPDLYVANYSNEFWRILEDSTILMGGCRETVSGTEDGLPEGTSGKIQGAIERFLGTVYPALKGWPVRYRWAGHMATTCEVFPMVGPLPGHPCLQLCVGFGEFGLLQAYAAGRTVARLIETGHSEAPFLVPRPVQI